MFVVFSSEAEAMEMALLIEAGFDDLEVILNNPRAIKALIVLHAEVKALVYLEAHLYSQIVKVFSVNVVVKMEINRLLDFYYFRELSANITSFFFHYLNGDAFVIPAHLPSLESIVVLEAHTNHLVVFEDAAAKDRAIVNNSEAINLVVLEVSIYLFSRLK